ncbi:MAG: DUF368 domain-containing protein [Schleiferiaceae bacterium]|nr:DUF368 domain-containing protein [Schleiferiaceae bacterium]
MNFFWILLKGLGMGAADVVPGVSGGTIAYITGIYQRLLDSIAAIGGKGWSAWRSEGILGLWKAVDGNFLVALGSGIAISILSLSKLVLWGLNLHPQIVWGFFFGLIIASLPLVLRGISKRDILRLSPAWIGGIGLGVLLSFLSPAQAELTLTYTFFSGAIAICAMILPGISGSFILVLLGSYEGILEALHARDWPHILVFMTGAVVGLLSFARLLRRLFGRYPKGMIVLMAGFIAGSLVKIWPFQAEFAQQASPMAAVLGSIGIGLTLVYGLHRWSQSLKG